MNDLHARAAAVGLSREWTDADGHPQIVSDDALGAILEALGDRPAGPLAFASANIGETIALPGLDGPATLRLEDGSARSVRIENGTLPPIGVIGYHRLEHADRVIRLAIAPPRCVTIADLAPGRRLWGPAIQIPALRGDHAFGDFGTLANAARAFAVRGADALAISPTHALFPADAQRFSPYAPSSRRFLNTLLADPTPLGIADGGPQPQLIDWHDAIPARRDALRVAFEQISADGLDEITRFRIAGGADLERQAQFDALHAYFFALSGASGWRDWPTAFHDPAGQTVADFVTRHRRDVDFHIFLQWAADQGLASAQRAALDAGMAIGLIADLAVGLDPGGAHGWARRGDLLGGLAIGAPPDPLGPDGQNWGITAFDPRAMIATGFEAFIPTIRAGLRHAGGLRIDHAFGLRRLWVMPEGAPATEGAYLDMPFADMMRVIAIESRRARAIVIGEDLGTVPGGFRAAMDARAMLGMRVLWFERGGDGGFMPPRDWSPDAVAMTGTHDLPTVAGWWRGRDIDWTWALGRASNAIDETADRANRARDRSRLWQAFETGAPEPGIDDADPVVDAAIIHIGRSPCALAIIPLEDLAGLIEQPNLPGTIAEHPNWRRRMPETTERLLARPDVTARIAALNAARA